VARLPHDRSDLLFSQGSVTELFQVSIDRWVDVMMADERGGGDAVSTVVIARIITKQDGILCGIPVVERLLERHCQAVIADWNFSEGESISTNNSIVELHGDSSEILRVERTILNIIGRMSGIASFTAKWVSKIDGIDIACTRKTEWGLLDKWAVHIGGGLTHRLDRSDAIMLKENDFAAQQKRDSKDMTNSTYMMVENIDLDLNAHFTVIEVGDEKMAIEVAMIWKRRQVDRNGSERVVLLLDNMGPELAKDCVKSLERLSLEDWCVVEGSGGIDYESLQNWSVSGVDLISTSAINRGVAPLDFSMLILSEDM
jgi:nicotinate-nucleotide pyrophosphorylase (carboxylating)